MNLIIMGFRIGVIVAIAELTCVVIKAMIIGFVKGLMKPMKNANGKQSDKVTPINKK